MFRYAAWPFQLSPLILLMTFTLLLTFALRSILLGLLLTIVLVSWFFKYCFALLDAAIAGEDEPPVLSVEMVNPVSEQRPLAQLILVGLSAFAVAWLGRYFGHVVGAVAGAALLFLLPASIAVMGITKNPLRAAWPPTLAAFVRGLGLDYVWLVLATFGCAAVVYALASSGLSRGPLVGLTMLFFMTVACLIGGAIFTNRDQLGIATRTRQERRAERDRQEHEAQRRALLDEAFAQLRLRRSLDAWQAIEKWLAKHQGKSTEDEEYLAVLHAASQWPDPAVADKLANEYIALLLSKRRTGEALHIAEKRMATNAQFRVAPPTQAQRLAELAGLAGKRALKRQIEGG